MTRIFTTQNSNLLSIDGFLYGVDKKAECNGGYFNDIATNSLHLYKSIGMHIRDEKGNIHIDANSKPVVFTNNPSLEGVPKIGELTNDNDLEQALKDFECFLEEEGVQS